MFAGLKTLAELLIKWRVEPSPFEELAQAQAIVTQAGGAISPQEPGAINKELAKIVQGLCAEYSLPVIPQGEVAVCLGDVPLLARTETQQESKHHISTHDIALFQKAVCNRYGFTHVILVAFGLHTWRAKKTLERLGFRVSIPHSLTAVPFEPKSSQWFCRNKYLFVLYELFLARPYFLMRGWI